MENSIEEMWHWYAGLNGITAKEKEELLVKVTNLEELYGADKTMPEFPAFRDEKQKERIVSALSDKKQREESRASYEKMKQAGIRLVAREMDGYPEKLKQIYLPPLVLYYYGELPKEDVPSIAIVGARNCSVYGREVAAEFSRALSGAGVQIISGMARGIDGSAQQAAISLEGRAYAVLGSGVDVCYPKEQKMLYEQLKREGGVISEELPGTPPLSYNFPKRNRIISALSDGVLVVEAREKSGSFITAGYALEQGKEIFAIPGRIHDSLSAGTNRLIKEGAQLVCEPEEVLIPFAERFHAYFGKNEKKENVLLATKDKIVYASLGLEPKHIEQIAKETNIPLPELACLLLELEMKHYIKQPVKNFYIYDLN